MSSNNSYEVARNAYFHDAEKAFDAGYDAGYSHACAVAIDPTDWIGHFPPRDSVTDVYVPLSTEDLTAIERRWYRIETPLPWRAVTNRDYEGQDIVVGDEIDDIAWVDGETAYHADFMPGDATFIAAAPDDVRRLLDEIRYLRNLVS